eukprot:TRINITY_DN6316_c0_g1_i1.p1 TRINITY_DN6316_c0_g1~~TRINITY_DN6316_c0_g1_i1.p1  ORF type:complete len:396 (+),score=34.75 TRINITY_DN6316_c0_g1_i1:61-1188(+)
MAAAVTPRAPAIAVLLFATVHCTDAKGSAYGVRTSGSMATSTSSSRAYQTRAAAGVAVGGYFAYRVGSRNWAPSYGTWEDHPYWNPSNGTCGTCPCPAPRESATEAWVWVQTRIPSFLCTDCAGENDSVPVSSQTGAVDVVTFEVDAFKEIAARQSCSPPTQVIVLRLCAISGGMIMVNGGLADDQLLDPKQCTVVGDEASQPNQHFAARFRRLLQTSSPSGIVLVMQFVVGATSVSHGNSLHGPILDAIGRNDSRLRSVYNLPPNAAVSVLTETPERERLDATLLFVIMGGICLTFLLVGVVVMIVLLRKEKKQHTGVVTATGAAKPAAETQPTRGVPIAESVEVSPHSDNGMVLSKYGTTPPPGKTVGKEEEV